MRLGRGAALIYTLTGLGLATQPLFGILHVEASAVVAAVAFFTAGWTYLTRQAALGAHLRNHVLGLLIPWALLTVTLLWRPNCAYVAGLGFYGLFALPSVMLGTALAYALKSTGLRWKRAAFVAVGLAVATLPVAYDLGLHPQLYTYNHVWGGALGPIYDEELAVRPGLFAFRGLTLAWAGALVALGAWLRRHRRRDAWIGGAAMVLVILGYVFAVPLGINTSYARLDAALGAQAVAEDVVIHYDADAFPEAEVAALQDELAFRYAMLEDRLGVAPDVPVHIYVYPDPETRGALIGSRRTSVTPVWLARPQLHMLQEALTPDALGHELVHVFSREFGLPVLKASLAVGLVEGLAVALEPPDGLPTPAQQVAATLRVQADSLGALEAGPAAAVAGAMDPFGFWTGRGAVSYVTTGAFASWLLARYGADAMRAVYATGDFQGVYGAHVLALAEAWEADLAVLPPSPEAEAVALWRFSQPSLFERRCPHHVPPAVRWTRRAREAELEGDAVAALDAYGRALRADSAFLPALVGWSARSLLTGRSPDLVVQQLRNYGTLDRPPEAVHLVALGDAYRIAGDSTRAQAAYATALTALPPWSDASRAFIRLRARLSKAGVQRLLGTGTAADRAEHLAQLPLADSAVVPFAAWLWREAGHLGPAYETLAPWRPETGDVLVEREVLAWKADFALRARRHREALRWARRARARFVEAGQGARVRQLDDVIAQARWHLGRG